MAIAEAISLYHQDRDLALRMLDEWSGKRGASADRIYERGAWLPRKPYPCAAGFQKTIELYDSAEMRQHETKEFYDDSIVREIDTTGFFDRLYRRLP